MSAAAASAASTSPPPGLPEQWLPHLGALLPDLSVGAILGFCAGYAVKKLGRMALLLTGLLFIAVQILASQGLVTVHWDRVQAGAAPLLRGGGALAWTSVLHTLQTNLPFGGAFAAALLVGLRAR